MPYYPQQYGWGEALAQWGNTLSRWGQRKEEEAMNRLKNRYGNNVEAWRQDALKNPQGEEAKYYKKFVGDPSQNLPEDPAVAERRRQAQFMRQMGPEWTRAADLYEQNAPEFVIRASMPKERKELTPEQLINIAELPSKIAVAPKPEAVNALKGWVESGGQPQPLPDYTEGVGALLGGMSGMNPMEMYRGMYQIANPPGYMADIGNITSGFGKTKKEAELEEAAKREAESLRRFEIGQVNYKDRTKQYAASIADASKRAWDAAEDRNKKTAVAGIKAATDAQLAPLLRDSTQINTEIKSTEKQIAAIEKEYSWVLANKEKRSNPKYAEKVTAYEQLKRDLADKKTRARVIESDIRKVQERHNSALKEVMPELPVYTIPVADDEDEADTFTNNS